MREIHGSPVCSEQPKVTGVVASRATRRSSLLDGRVAQSKPSVTASPRMGLSARNRSGAGGLSRHECECVKPIFHPQAAQSDRGFQGPDAGLR